MANYSFEVTLKANAAQFAAAMKQSLGQVQQLQSGSQSATSGMNQGFFSVGNAIKGIFGIDLINLFLKGLDMVRDSVMFIADKMKDILTDLIETGSKWEQSNIGISAQIASMGEVRDQYGHLVDDETKWQKAKLIGLDIQKDLLKMSLTNIGTLDDYQKAFQGISMAIAGTTKDTDPGKIYRDQLEATKSIVALAKMNPDIMKGGTSTGVSEYAELLRGNYRGRSDIVKLLGVTKEDIESWKEAGTLQQNLNEKMHFYVVASGQARYSFEGMKNTLTSVFQMFKLGLGADMFKHVEAAMRKIVDMLVVTKNGVVGLNPDISRIAQVLQTIFSGSGEAAKELIDKIIDYIKNHGPTLTKLGYVINDTLMVTLKIMGDILDIIDKLDQPIQQAISSLDKLVLGTRDALKGFAQSMPGLTLGSVYAGGPGNPEDIEKRIKKNYSKDNFNELLETEKLANEASKMRNALGKSNGLPSFFDLTPEAKRNLDNLRYSYSKRLDGESESKDPWEKMIGKIKQTSMQDIMSKILEFQTKTGLLPKINQSSMGYDKNKQIVEFKITDPRGGGSKSFMAEMTPQDRANFTDFINKVMEQNQRMNENYGNPTMSPRPVVRGY